MTSIDFSRERSLIPAAPKVLHTESTWSPSTEVHAPKWDVVAYPKDEDQDDFQIVIGTLHAAGDEGHVYVTVGAMMMESGSVAKDRYSEEFLELLAESEALETVYALARIHALTISATTGFTLELPLMFGPATSIEMWNGEANEGADERPALENETGAE